MTTGTVSRATLGILGTHWQAATRDEDIDLESGEYVPVGHIWKVDLEEHKLRNFGRKLIFQIFEWSLSCSTFSRKLKIPEIEEQNIRFTIAGNYLKKQREIAFRNFQIQNKRE